MSLVVRDLCVSFGGLPALDHFSLTVEPGEILGLIGPNGSGKTTATNAMTGFVPATSGSVSANGVELIGRRPQDARRAGIARTFQHMRLFKALSVEENLILACQSVRGSKEAARVRARALLRRAGMEAWCDARVEQLPYGDERRVSFWRAVALQPQFLILDEPAAGLGEEETSELGKLIVETRDQLGCGVLLIEHDMDLVMSVCVTIQVLDHGETIAIGSPAEIRADSRVTSVYLG